MPELEAWRKKGWNPDTGIGEAFGDNGYMDAVIIEELDDAGEVLLTWTLQNSFPLSIGQGQLTYASSEAKLITVTLSCDYFEVE